MAVEPAHQKTKPTGLPPAEILVHRDSGDWRENHDVQFLRVAFVWQDKENISAISDKGSSMGLKLNKWQRVGIILSVIAFVGLALQAWVFQARQRDQFYNMQLSLCEDTLRTENELAQNVGKQEDRANRAATNQTEYESCKAESAELLRKSFDSSYKTMPIFLAKVLAIIIFAWLLEWIIVETLRWMRRGSRV